MTGAHVGARDSIESSENPFAREEAERGKVFRPLAALREGRGNGYMMVGTSPTVTASPFGHYLIAKHNFLEDEKMESKLENRDVSEHSLSVELSHK